MNQADPERFAYDDDRPCEWARDESQKAIEAEREARGVLLQVVRDAARRYGTVVRDKASMLINRFCMATRRDTQDLDEAIEHFVKVLACFTEDAADGDFIDQDKLRDLLHIAGETE